MIGARLRLFVLLGVWAGALFGNVCSQVVDEPTLPFPGVRESRLRSHYRAESLLSKVRSSKVAISEESQASFVQVLDEMDRLSVALRREEEKLHELKEMRRILKKQMGWNWWFDLDSRFKVLESDLQINDQTRVVQNIKEDVDLHWAKLKPFFGVFSELFLLDILSFIPYAFFVMIEFIHAIFELGIIAIVVGGPALFILVVALGSLFGSFSALFFGAPLLVACILWIINLPFIILQYNPSVSQFFLAYVPIILFFGHITLLLLSYVKPTAAVELEGFELEPHPRRVLQEPRPHSE